ncbi:hypothetical protein [Microbacterium gilvum]|uniref:DUF4190 domain-containing protein n=1 Tax=Microbacterium gilvum TaxID=1336204 RepID=A0ABP9AAW1_9MICO
MTTEPEDAAQLADDELLNTVPPPRRRARRRVSVSSPSMTLGMFSLTMAWFTPWVAPLGVVAVVLALVALLRRQSDRPLAWWGLGFGLVALAFCAIWAIWILDQLGEVPAIELPVP